jgi:hypothetical protein
VWVTIHIEMIRLNLQQINGNSVYIKHPLFRMYPMLLSGPNLFKNILIKKCYATTKMQYVKFMQCFSMLFNIKTTK